MVKRRIREVSPTSHAPKEGATHTYLNRDLSWLEFNRRVLFQITDDKLPLLERVKFLAIFTSNLDEFIMKRVGYLKRVLKKGAGAVGPDGYTPEQVMALVRSQVMSMTKERDSYYVKVIIPELKKQGIYLESWDELSPAEKQEMKSFFHKKIFPVLTPLAVDPAHPFPFLSNLSVSLGVSLKAPHQEKMLFARLKIPDVLPQWIKVSGDVNSLPMKFIRLQDVIENNLHELFPQMQIVKVTAFRVMRNAELDLVDEDGTGDLLEIVEEELRLRRLADVVLLQHGLHPDPWVMDLLKAELDLTADDMYEHEGELNFNTLGEIAGLNLPHLKFKPWHSITNVRLADENYDIFRVIQEGDLLVHHPYESFSHSVERFIRSAVDDPHVMAIKMTVYRTGDKSPFIPLLIEAAESGKQVVCVVEVKARFDEARNLFWAEKLENAGVHVVYGVVGYKTHTKLALVVRKEQDDFNFYAHIGTGNYNNETARLYTDLGLFTCKTEITGEVIQIFNYLTGLSRKQDYTKFLVAPLNMRARFEALIDREIANIKAGQPSHIIVKVNNLEDHLMCEKLFEASRAGVKIDLIVRGICTLRPALPGISENIRVISIVGRFLEHSRIFYFRNAADDPVKGDYYIGSADWMGRNLNNRMETVIPVQDTQAQNEIWHVLQVMLEDKWSAWSMDSEGRYHLARAHQTDEETRTHDKLMQIYSGKRLE